MSIDMKNRDVDGSFFSSVFGLIRFGTRFGSVRGSANRYIFELICGSIYSVVIVNKFANRTKKST